MPQTEFSQVYNENKEKQFRVQTEWEDHSFKIYLLNESSAWFATVTEDHINNLAEQHEVKAETYFKDLKSYICKDQSNVNFDVKDKQFIIYRNISTEKLRLKYFLVKLQKVTYQEAAESIIDNLIVKCSETSKMLSDIREEKVKAITQKIALEKQYEDFVELKRKSELEMYSAFALTLNEKKHRIRFLTELLECPKKQKQNVHVQHKEENISDNDEITNADTKLEVLSDSESNKTEDYNTEDEKESEKRKFEAVPGTSKTNFDFLGGDSPPPLLPKRIKIDHSCTQNSTLNVNKKVEKIKPVIVTKDESEDEENDFNSQDILDRM